MNFYLSPCFKTWVSSHRTQTTMQNTMLTTSNTMQNLSKPDCKTPLIHLYLISSLPVKGLPFKTTFTTYREQHHHWGMVADKFFWGANADPSWIIKTNASIFFFHVRKGFSRRDFFTLERILKLNFVWRECGRDRKINPAFSTDREISYLPSYSYFSPCAAK